MSEMTELTGIMDSTSRNNAVPLAAATLEPYPHKPFTIATISAGFEKGDFLVREEQGARIYFDFFEEAFNYIANKGYSRMAPQQEKEWVDLMNVIHDSVKGGMKYNTGTLLMVLTRPVDIEIAKAMVTSTSSGKLKKDTRSQQTPMKGGDPGVRGG